MSLKITSSNFKLLISEKKTPKEIIFKKTLLSNIKVKIESEAIYISGDFTVKDDLIFNSSDKYEKDLIFDGGTFKNIIFKGGKFKKISFQRGEYQGYISLRGGNIENLVLLGGNFLHWLGTMDGELNSDKYGQFLAEEKLIINRFEIEGGNYQHNIWISGGQINSLELKCVTPVIIHCKPNDDKNYLSSQSTYISKHKSKLTIHTLLISRLLTSNSFYHFSEFQIENILFDKFTNLGNITMSGIILNESLNIFNSDLVQSTFIDCKFSDGKLNFKSSKITEISLPGTTLPNPNNVSNTDEYQRKLALSQIKKVYQSLGDNLTANKYHTEELNSHYSTLKFSSQKFNLWLNQNTNRHGQSWVRPLLLLLISTSIFFSLFCLSLGFKFTPFQSKNYSQFYSNLGFFLEFLNPLRKSNNLPELLLKTKDLGEVSSLTYLIDNISKILNAYLLYQFVAAFRKYGRIK